MIPLKKAMQSFLAIVFLFCMSTCGEKISVDTSAAIPEKIKTQLVSPCVSKANFIDSLGEHFFVLIRKYSVDNEGKEEVHLMAQQWVLKNYEWVSEWVIKDNVECQRLDIGGDFFTGLTTFTDLDNNKIIETTVAYFLICTGAVEPKTIKVIMRQGETKYAVRGESLVVVDEKTKYGGTFKADQTLNSKILFKDHLISIWRKAAGVN